MFRLRVTDRIMLKRIELSDAADIFQAIDSQRKYLGKWLPFVKFTNNVSDTEQFIASINANPSDDREYVFVILYDNQFAGIVGFKSTDKVNKKTEIGYWLSRHFQKMGIVTLSVMRLIEFAWEEMGMNRIQIRCAAGNVPSKRIPKRLRFRFEGIERDGELLSGDVFTDLEVYSLLRRDNKAE